MPSLLILLIAVPVVAWVWSRKRYPSHLWLITGAAFGAVISPFSIGLYSTYFLHPIGIATGLVGLLLSLFHAVPGFEIATFLGLRDAGTVVQGVERLYVEGLNAIVWAIVYGFVGWCVDRLRSLRRGHA